MSREHAALTRLISDLVRNGVDEYAWCVEGNASVLVTVDRSEWGRRS